jgi:non-homologous end joining protein Ku
MAPRAYWKGYLKLSLVSCPIALYPATSEREKISFSTCATPISSCPTARSANR